MELLQYCTKPSIWHCNVVISNHWTRFHIKFCFLCIWLTINTRILGLFREYIIGFFFKFLHELDWIFNEEVHENRLLIHSRMWRKIQWVHNMLARHTFFVPWIWHIYQRLCMCPVGLMWMNNVKFMSYCVECFCLLICLCFIRQLSVRLPILNP